MKHEMTTRFATREDIPNIVEWTHANREKNHYDPAIFDYPSTRVLAVEKDGEPECFMPYQLVIMTESLAPKPGLSKIETAICLRESIHNVAAIAQRSGIQEIYFMGTDDETVEFAKAHGYEELKTMRVMRLKINKMQPPLPAQEK